VSHLRASKVECLTDGRHHALPALRAHARANDDADRLDSHITLDHERKPVGGDRRLRSVRLDVCHFGRVVVVPGGIPRHVSDSVAFHDQDLTPAVSPSLPVAKDRARLWDRRKVAAWA
jgi:hypothetical protein